MDSWSKEDYSRHVREASMAVEKLPEVNPPSGRVPGRGLLTLPISEALRRRNDGEIRDSGCDARVFSRRTKYRPKEGTGGGGTHPGDLLARPRAWPCQQVSSEAPGPSFVIRKLMFCWFFIYFSGFFGDSENWVKAPAKKTSADRNWHWVHWVSRLVQICVKWYKSVAKHITMSPKRSWNKQKL